MRPDMSRQDSKSSPEKFLNHLIDVISESLENDPDALKEALAEEGINQDELIAEGLHFVKTLEREQRFAEAQEKQNRLTQLLDAVRTNKFEGTKDELLATLKGFFSDKVALAYFNKLKSIEEEDLRKIVTEIETLKLFAKEMENETDNE